MAASSIAAPGKIVNGREIGPCVGTCAHRDCALTRAAAAAPCRICGKPIGYETRYYEGPEHALCAEVAAEKHQCAGRVYTDSYSQPTRRCERNATVEEAGAWWCSSHAPSLRAARSTAKDAEYEATRQKSIALRRRSAAEAAACRGLSTEALEAGAIAELVAVAQALNELMETLWPNVAVERQWPERVALRVALAKFTEVTP